MLIKNPIDRGYLNDDLEYVVEIDDFFPIPYTYDELQKEFETLYPQYRFMGLKCSDDLCPKKRIFLFYNPNKKKLKPMDLKLGKKSQLQENRLKHHAEDCPRFKYIMELLYRTLNYKNPDGILFGKTILQSKFEYCPCCGQRLEEVE